MSLKQTLRDYLPAIDTEMRRLMTPPTDSPPPFYGMMHYHLGWMDRDFKPVEAPKAGGKRLRPAFTLIANHTLGGQLEKALPAAAAIELIHNFTLVHDDVQDQSETRRGRPTVWTIWGEAQAINVGDSLFVLARNALLSLRAQGVAPETVLTAVQKLDETCLALCQGQYLDMHFETTFEVDLAAYLTMIRGKTAALLACAGYLGALIASDDPAEADTFWQLGEAMGLAFQIQDDWLGIWGDEATTGKATADDLRRRKKSLPVVFALSHASPEAERFRTLYRAESLSEAEIQEAISLLEAMGAKAYTESQAQHYVSVAETALQNVNAAEEEAHLLKALAEFFVQRVY